MEMNISSKIENEGTGLYTSSIREMTRGAAGGQWEKWKWRTGEERIHGE
jgi:hypothetical protein